MKSQIFRRILVVLIFFGAISSAQHMFYHLLPQQNLDPFVWTGLAGDNDWNNINNWSTYIVPSTGNTAKFQGNACTGAACDVTISISISVAGIEVDSNYVGTITQDTGNTITIGSAGWIQASGTFVGGDSNITFNSSTLTLSGTASFTSTTAQTFFNLQQGVATNVITLAATNTLTFPNGSTQKFSTLAGCSTPFYQFVSPTKISFNDVIVETGSTGCAPAAFGNTSTAIEVRGDFSFATALGIAFRGTWEVYGNISSIGNLASSTPNTATWYLKGSTNTTYEGPGGLGYLVIDKSGGASVTPKAGTTEFSSGGISILQGAFTFPDTFHIIKVSTSALTDFFKVAAGTTVTVPADSTVNVTAAGACGSPTYTIDVDGTYSFENLTLIGYGTGCGAANLTAASGDVITVKKSLTPSKDVNINIDFILEGNLLAGTGNPYGTMGLSFSDSNSKTGAMNTSFTSGNWVINKPSGQIQFQSNIVLNNAGQDVTITDGTVDMNAKNFTINDVLTISTNGKLICNGGTVSAASYVVTGEVSCGPTIGITWTGAAGDNLWTTAGNWTDNTVPGATDIAIFNSKCSGANCDVTIDTSISVKGMNITSAYTGTITQDTGMTITVGSSNWVQAAGTFTGGDSAITINGTYSLSGGTFSAPSATVSVSGNFTVSGSPTFNAGTSTLNFSNTSPIVITPGSAMYNNVTFPNPSACNDYDLNSGTMDIAGTLTITATTWCGGSRNINNGTIRAYGDVNTSNGGMRGTATLVIAGNTSGQTITGTTAAMLPPLEIAAGANNVTFSGYINVTGNYTVTSVGTLTTTGSTLAFYGSSAHLITPGSFTYNNVTFPSIASCTTFDLNAGTLNVAGTLTFQTSGWCSGGPRPIENGTIVATGNLTAAGDGASGSVLVQVAGTGNQTLSGVSAAYIPNIEIVSTGGIVTLSGTLQFRGDYTYTSGTVDAGTSTLQFANTGTITPGAVAYNNVTFSGYVTTQTLVGSMTINGTLSLTGTSSSPRAILNGGTLLASGNVSVSSKGYIGTTLLKIVGSGNQAVSGASGSAMLATEIASTGGTVSFSGSLNIYGDYTYTSGAISAGTSSLGFPSTATITPGTVAYNNVTFSGYALTQTLSGTMTVNGTLNLSGSSSSPPPNLNSGTLSANGNVVFDGYGYNGTTVINIEGSTTTTLNNGASAKELNTSIVVNKSGGSQVTLTSNFNIDNVGQDLTISNGTLDLNGYALTVADIFTIDATGILKCNGGTYTQASLVNNGTINCPGYSTYDFNWTGAGGDSNWNTPGNWQGGVAPGANDVAAFEDTYCGANCNVTINVPITIKGLETFSPYTGTITQGAGNNIYIGSLGWNQSGGNFVGSDSNISITGSTFSFTSTGSFTSTSGLFQLTGYQTDVDDTILTLGSSSTFNHNSGTFKFSNYGTWSKNPNHILDVPNLTEFHNVILHQYNAKNSNSIGYMPVSGRTIVVTGDFTHGEGAWSGISAMTRVEGQWEVRGNFIVGTNATGGTGSVSLTSTGAQSITADSSAYTADLIINKSSGTASMNAGSTTLRVRGFYLDQGSFTAPSGTLESYNYSTTTDTTLFRIATGTTFNTNSGTVKISAAAGWMHNRIYTLDVPNMFQFNNLILHQLLAKNSNTITYAPVSGRTIAVSGNLTHGLSEFVVASGNSKMNGLWQVQGNYTIGTDANGGTGSITLNGTGAQNITGSAGTPAGGTFIVNKASGTATLTANLSLNTASQDLTITSGTLNMSGRNLTVNRNITNAGTLRRGTSPSCGTLSYGGSYTGTAAVCP